MSESLFEAHIHV